jgi:3-dehydroquinate dehydratase/shikimate dehydrogenase
MADKPARTALIVSLTQSTVEDMRAAMRAAAEAGADMVELRLDHLDRVDRTGLRALLADRPLPVIVTYRPVRQGGRFDGPEPDRLGVLFTAAKFGAEYVDVEDDVPADQRPTRCRVIVSHHDFEKRPVDLAAFAADADERTVFKKIAFASAGPEDGIAALARLRQSGRPAICLAMGPRGVLSRILAGKFGAFGTFASAAAGAEAAPGQLTVEEMKGLYRWDAIGADTRVYGVIGCPVAHSMSPAIHNAAFAGAGLDAVYVPLRVEPGAECFDRFVAAAAAAPWLDLKGLSVTLPHKENALAAVGPGNVDELSRRIGAINTIRIEPDGALRGWNTDYAAATDALCAAMGIDREGLAGRSVAVLGAGGASRALVASLTHYGADVSIYNRTVPRGEKLAAEFGAKAFGRDALEALAAEVVINCTSIGMHPNVDDTPLPPEALPRVKVVFDTVYNPVQTRLLDQAAAAGCTCVTGVDMFVNQAVAQFEIWTDRPAPRDVMRDIVLQKLRPAHP